MRAFRTYGLCLWVYLLPLAGCTSIPYLARPDWSLRVSQIEKIVVLPPRIQVYEISADGSRREVAAWSEQARRNLIVSLDSELNARRDIVFKRVPAEELSEAQVSLLADVQGLLNAIGLNILWHVYGPAPEHLVDITQRFDFSLGRDLQELTNNGVDAMLLINGLDHVSTPGRLALEVVRASASGPLGAILNPPRLGETWVSIALADPSTGEILWYRIVQGSSGGYDARDLQSVSSLLKKLLIGFPIS